MKIANRYCNMCGSQFSVKKSALKHGSGHFCSTKCKTLNLQDTRDGGTFTKKIDIPGHSLNSGYIFVMSKDHPHRNRDGYVRQHRLVMEEHLGRYLDKNEIVHHIDGNKLNNSLDNLEVITRVEHARSHYEEKLGNRWKTDQKLL